MSTPTPAVTNQKGVVISIRMRDADYAVVEKIARELYDQNQLKAPTPAALTKVALNVLCNQYLQMKAQTVVGQAPPSPPQQQSQPQA